MKDAVLGFNDGLYSACVWVAGLSIAIMSLIIPWGIFTRYVLGSGSQWPEPVSILLMVLFTFLGSASAYRAGSHIAVAMITSRLPSGLQPLVAKVMTVLMGLVALFMAYYGVTLVMSTWGQSIPEIPAMRAGAAYLPVPIAGVITFIFVLESLLYGDQSQRRAVQGDAELEAGLE